jgi:hypothetical protein
MQHHHDRQTHQVLSGGPLSAGVVFHQGGFLPQIVCKGLRMITDRMSDIVNLKHRFTNYRDDDKIYETVVSLECSIFFRPHRRCLLAATPPLRNELFSVCRA